MKKLAAVIILVVILFALSTASVSGATNYYTAVNDKLLPAGSAYAPILYKGAWYVPSSVFASGELGVSASYNRESYSVAVSGSGGKITFNLDLGVAYDDENMYRNPAIELGGNVYLPAKFLGGQVGFEMRYFESIKVLRLTSGSQNMGSATFEAAIKREIDAQAPTARPSVSPGASPAVSASPLTPSPSPSPTPQPRNRTVYLTFNYGPECEQVLDELDRYGMRAVFFVDAASIMESAPAIRRIAGSGHAIGLTARGGTPEELIASLTEGNAMLEKILFTKTRLARVDGGSGAISEESADALIREGYRYWDWNIQPADSRAGISAQSAVKTMTDRLAAAEQASVLVFNCNEMTMRTLPQVLRFLRDERYTVRLATLVTMPINQRGDVRPG